MRERNAQPEEENARVREELARLREQVARLEQRGAAARKDFSTSFKPPSIDIVKQKKPAAKGSKKRKKGGRPGHQQHERSPFPPEGVNPFQLHTLECCRDCGGRLPLSRREPEVLPQVEITETPTVVTEHQGLGLLVPALPQSPLRAIAGRGSEVGPAGSATNVWPRCPTARVAFLWPSGKAFATPR